MNKRFILIKIMGISISVSYAFYIVKELFYILYVFSFQSICVPKTCCTSQFRTPVHLNMAPIVPTLAVNSTYRLQRTAQYYVYMENGAIGSLVYSPVSILIYVKIFSYIYIYIYILGSYRNRKVTYPFLSPRCIL